MREAQQAEVLQSQGASWQGEAGGQLSLVWVLQGMRIFLKTQCDQGRPWASETTNALISGAGA